jgi:hypothetical protein
MGGSRIKFERGQNMLIGGFKWGVNHCFRKYLGRVNLPSGFTRPSPNHWIDQKKKGKGIER